MLAEAVLKPSNTGLRSAPTVERAEKRPLPASFAIETAPVRIGTALDELAGSRFQRGVAAGRRRGSPASSRERAVLPKLPEEVC